MLAAASTDHHHSQTTRYGVIDHHCDNLVTAYKRKPELCVMDDILAPIQDAFEGQIVRSRVLILFD